MERAFYCRARTDSCAESASRRLKLASVTMLVVGAAAVVAQSFAAFADEVPTFNLGKTCKADVLAYQGTASGQASNTGCLRSEQESANNACEPVDAVFPGKQTGVHTTPRRRCRPSELC
jgi:hypothetical protein